jgi:hypothetical protein
VLLRALPIASCAVLCEAVPKAYTKHLRQQLRPDIALSRAIWGGEARNRRFAPRCSTPFPSLPLSAVCRGQPQLLDGDLRKRAATAGVLPWSVESEPASTSATRCRSARDLMAARRRGGRRGDRALRGPPPWPIEIAFRRSEGGRGRWEAAQAAAESTNEGSDSERRGG